MRTSLRGLAAAVVLLATFVALISAAEAKPITIVQCTQAGCITEVVDDGSGTADPTGGSTGAATQCTYFGKAQDSCDVPGLGFNPGGRCWYRLQSPQPPVSDPIYAGHAAGAGLIYVRDCGGTTGIDLVWLANGVAPGPPPAAVLAQRALARLSLPTLTAMSSARATQTAYVGVATWLWVTGPWAPVSSRAAVAARAVTLTATPVGVSWDMGDGSARYGCAGPGTPLTNANMGTVPPCAYTYVVSSLHQPQTGPSVNDRFFHVQAYVTFLLHWTCAGDCDQAAGDLPAMPKATAPLPLRVFEIETVVVTR